jgi:hypothetical protein
MAGPALFVVDPQQAFDDAEYWGRRNNPGCEANVAALVDAWRTRDLPACGTIVVSGIATER